MLSLVPIEVLEKIVGYLDDWDLISFAISYEQVSHRIASTKRKLILKPDYGSSLTASSLCAFAMVCSQYDTLFQLDLSNCYWFDGELITEVIQLTSKSIRSLAIQGTKISFKQIARALEQCRCLTNLSISMSKKDFNLWFSVHDTKDAPKEYNPVKLFEIFSECSETLGNISSLRLYCDEVELPIIVLCFCYSLKSLHLDINESANVSMKESFEKGFRLRKLRHQVRLFENLTSITGRINTPYESVDFFEQFARNVLLNLWNQPEILWLPNVSEDQCEDINRVKTLSLKSFQTYEIPDSMNQNVQLKHLRTTDPSFLNKFCLKFEFLTEVSCCYDPEHFVTFASVHRNLKVLQLMPTHLSFGTNAQLKADTLAKGLAYFKQLEKLSIGYGVAKDEEFQGMLGSSSNLDELEFGLFLHNLSRLRTRESIEELAVFPQIDDLLTYLPQCTNKLLKLTLANINLSSYNKISQVLKSCTRLKSLRLSNIICIEHPEEWISILREGLSQAKHLEDFRYGIEGIYSYGQMERLKAFDSQLDSYLLPVDQLVLALYDCRSLRRFAILSHINVAVTSAVELDWPSLIFACFVLPQPICDSFKVNINSSNPAHICFVGSSMAESFHLPHVHRNDLIQMDSKVCKMPSKLSAGGFPCE